jgi:hypothetical protein
MPPLPRLVIFLLLLVIGIFIVVREGHLLLKSSQSDSWLSTDGIVKTAEIKQWRAGLRKGRPQYRTVVTYDYSVDGRALTGNTLRLERDTSSYPFSAEADLRKYAVGTKVKVFYSPTDPSDSVIEPGMSHWNWLLPAVGCIMIAWFSYMIVATLRSR